MGVRYFEYFARNSVPNGCFSINMDKEIRKYVNASSAPTIVIDLLALNKPLSKYDEKALPFGGRFNVASAVAEEFFRTLTKLGAKLVFFCYGSVQEQRGDAWCARQEARYIKNLKAFDDVDKGISVESFIRRNSHFINSRLPLVSVAEKYGRVEMVSSTMFQRELATYATQSQALAILSSDSDYLIFQGSWRYWSSDSLDLSTLDTMEYNRSAIRHYLRLDQQHMPLFATLCGNKIMPYNVVSRIHILIGTDRNILPNIARFVRPLPMPTYRQAMLKCDPDQENVDEELITKCKQSMDFYNLNTNMDYSSPFGDPILELLTKQGSSFAFSIWQKKPLDVSIGDVDLRNPSYDYAQLLMSLIVRMAGIILFHKKPQRPTHFTVLIKLNHGSRHQEHRYAVQYPSDRNPPTLLELLSTDSMVHLHIQSIKFHLLSWIISDTLQPHRLQKVPRQLRHTVCTLYYLVEQKVLELFEADLFLQVAFDVLFKTYDPHSVEYPSTIKSRPYRMVFLFQKVHACTLKAFRLLGINGGNNAQEDITFDGVLFHKRYDEWSRGCYALDCIERFRIYAELVDVTNNG